MDKKQLLYGIFQYIIAFCLVYWLVGISIWLDLFLAAAMSKESFASTKLIELKDELEIQKSMFSIADNELIRVSALTTSLEDAIFDLEKKLSVAEDLLQDHDREIRSRLKAEWNTFS